MQAAGIDVFGAFGRWTAEPFQFVIPTAGQAQDNDGSTPNPEHEVVSDEFGDTINSVFTNAENAFFSINITRYNSDADMASRIFEKDNQAVEKYTRGDRTFYILSNLENTTATWSDGASLVMTFSGDISGDNLKPMIDSMGKTSE